MQDTITDTMYKTVGLLNLPTHKSCSLILFALYLPSLRHFGARVFCFSFLLVDVAAPLPPRGAAPAAQHVLAAGVAVRALLVTEVGVVHEAAAAAVPVARGGAVVRAAQRASPRPRRRQHRCGGGGGGGVGRVPRRGVRVVRGAVVAVCVRAAAEDWRCRGVRRGGAR